MIIILSGLLILAILIAIRLKIVQDYKINELKKQLKTVGKESVQKSKSIIKGQVIENLIPIFENFPYKLTECRFAGAPIDYIVFENMDVIREGSTEAKLNIIFADVKSNKSQYSTVQKAIKDAILNNRVKFEQWHLTNNNEFKIKK